MRIEEIFGFIEKATVRGLSVTTNVASLLTDWCNDIWNETSVWPNGARMCTFNAPVFAATDMIYV